MHPVSTTAASTSSLAPSAVHPPVLSPLPTPLPTPLHLLGNFTDRFTGAERELPDLAAVLQGRRECMLWSVAPPHPHYAAMGVRLIDEAAGQFPQGGMLLLGGVHVGVGEWVKRAGLSRIAIRYNLPQHERICRMTAYLEFATGIKPELLFSSAGLRLSVGLEGSVELSLIQLAPFLQVPLERAAGRPFTVGRASRDVLEKHNADDVMLYRMLAAQGACVRVMGGMCLAPWLEGVPGVELLPTGAVPIEEFFAGLDVFIYRTGTFHEPYGRVVLEAMATGLPVVVSNLGGFAEQVTHGETGYIFRTREEAFDAITRLKDDASLKARMGKAARAAAIAAHGDEAIAAMAQFYLR